MSIPNPPPPIPRKESLALSELLRPLSTEIRMKSKERIVLNADMDFEKRKLYVLTEGETGLYRGVDNLLVTNSKPVTIFGISEMFVPFNHNYIRMEKDCTFLVIHAPDVVQTLDSHNAWHMTTKILSHYVQHLMYRDARLIGQNAYNMVKSFIYDYEKLSPELKAGRSLSNHIMEKTSLSRTIITNIISDLNKGGYIEVNKGRLIRINKLPDRY
jgi:CRP-like cAMP-binding protein